MLLGAGVLIAGAAPLPLGFVLVALGANLVAYAVAGTERFARPATGDQSLDSPRRRERIRVYASFGRALIAIALALAALGGISELLVNSGRGEVMLWTAGMLLAQGTGAVWVWSRERREPEAATAPAEPEKQASTDRD